MLTLVGPDKRLLAIDEINDICLQNGSSVMILGGMSTGQKIAAYLKEQGVVAEIKFVVDDDYFGEMQRRQGYLSFSEYLSTYALISPLVFGFYNYSKIIEKRMLFNELIPHMYDFHITVVNGSRVVWDFEYVREHISAYNETYCMLSSNESRATMQAYLDAAVFGRFHELFVNHRDDISYFNSKMQGRNIDTLFDCGAFDGDSAHDFLNAFPNYKHIYEFEPDPVNVEEIKKRVDREDIRNLTIVEKGVWSETSTLRFSSEGKSSSSVSAEGDVAIEVIKLDDMYDCFTSGSLIKMDIEGSEFEALRGASRVIREISPALAVCVYHKREDLITIPQYINSLVVPNTYDYFLGYQGLDLVELVFYAIPKRA